MKNPPEDIHTDPEVETMTESEASATRWGTINVAGATAIGAGGMMRPAGPPSAAEAASGSTSGMPVNR